MVLIELFEEMEYYAGEYPDADVRVNIGNAEAAQILNLVERDDGEPGFALLIDSEGDYNCVSSDYLYERVQGLVLGLPERASYEEIEVYDTNQGFFIGSPVSIIVNERSNRAIGIWYEVVLNLA